jgi:type I restriction enzyme S subunit
MKATKFKETDSGLVPEDWGKFVLGESGKLQRTTINPQSFKDVIFTEYCMPAFDDGKTPLIKYGSEMQSNRTQISGSVLLYNKLNVRQRRIWYVDVTNNGSVCSTEFLPYSSDRINLKLLSYILDTDKVTNDFIGLSKGSSNSQKRISPQDFLDYAIFLPTGSEEQSNIASALASVDALILSLDKLISKKRDMKQGVMQQLFTGKIRLPGYDNVWEYKRLGSIGVTFSGLTGKTKEDFGGGNAKYITFLNVLNNPILKPSMFEEVSIKEGERQNRCHKGDLFFNTSSETPEEVGICSMLDVEMESLYLNSFCFGYRVTDSNVIPKFLAYFFRSNEGRKLMVKLAQGVTRYNMSKSAFNEAQILMPNSSLEQNAIADVLESMDNEIFVLEAKKAKYLSIKKGMMQELLTGKIRLV